MKIVVAILLLSLFLISLAVGAQNQIIVNFNYLLAQGDFQLSTLLGIFFATGFGLGWLICGSMYLKVSMTQRRLRKRLDKQTAELNRLRLDSTKG
ncbi:lipopolysaccharide assembly protein LapA domain-containing protein [Aliivibrio sp. S4TY2]|uniref:LapA family protein n=1 Tax=unclassified Aliivibrio TaxID=2645654 RepID=UPI0023788F4C|nr:MULTISPECIES: lipopolysaccharide assembly protein LapA domain-containing protein [unclassified Aliivibrio]MDD9154684.1 lipopolysaccharide assembly protein LapA domain-containing protein [Aliivibrio sp. S4TY2]MDD9158953.1 lipopolysaccharide assembly protein LapA domain-containing protein [Aliivibrio sp. S4TY1]MDD9162687.1 lipopolysaccharide assembly protein LapA domain-containing protein [Aliivibrio sp. S4MY2]MDD9166952.1 lipopolysaccharide assembly protein LapA domain-containing protein [Ali